MKLDTIMDRILAGIFRTSALVLHVLALSSSVGALNCYECHTESSCKTPQHKQCDGEFDACVLKTSWKGELYLDMHMSRYCGFASECPKASLNQSPFCNQTEGVLSCTMCCDDDYCNNGGSGKLLRPPPSPPYPPLVKDLPEEVCNSTSCSTLVSWTEESTVINVAVFCTTPEVTSEALFSPLYSQYNNTCHNSDHMESGFCVTCCSDGICANSSANSLSAIPVIAFVCLSIRWLIAS